MAQAGSAAATVDWRSEARDAAAAAFVAGALALALVGFRMVHVPGGIDLATRFDDVAAAVAVAFAGRLLIGIRPKAPRLALIGGAAAGILILALEAAAKVFPLAGAILFESAVVNAMMALAAFVLAARAGWDLWLGETAPDRPAQEALFAGWRAEAARFAHYLGPALLVLALLLPFLPGMDRRALDIAILVLTYVMLGWGLNIVVGLAGLLDLGYVAFYAVGAYSYALMAQYFGLGFWSCLPIAGLMAAAAGVLLGFPVLRLRGDYLAIVTLGFGEMIRVILLNWYEFTNGPDGISGVPRPTVFGLPLTDGGDGTTFYDVFGFEYSPLHRIWLLYYLILALALITNAFTLRIRKLPVGRAWEALREDEIACRSLGINPRNTKLTAFGIGAMFGGFAGAFFATRQGFVSPESFTFIESAVILAIVVLGGMGSQIGVVFAAIVLIGLPEFFRELQQYRMLAFGAAMVLIMLWRPSGLLAVRRPTVALPPAPAAETAR